MLRDALIIFRKELGNVMRDRRVILANYVLPLLLFPAFFFAISFFQDIQTQEQGETVYPVSILNAPDEGYQQILESIILVEPVDNPRARDVVTVQFPETGTRGEVQIYADSTDNALAYAGRMAEVALDQYEQLLASAILAEAGLQQADLDRFQATRVDVAPEEAQGTGILVAMLPYFIIIFVFAGSMGMGMTVTAGEKENGSLAGILVNQVSRSSIAIGKVLFLVTSALLNAVSSFAGILIAVSFGLLGDQLGGATSVGGLTTPVGLIALLVVLVTTAGFAASVIILLGSLARSMKEASGYIMPVYLIAILIGVATIGLDTAENLLVFLAPIVNAIFLLKGLILSQYTLVQVLLTAAVNLGVLALMTVFTSRVYNSERILQTTTA